MINAREREGARAMFTRKAANLGTALTSFARSRPRVHVALCVFFTRINGAQARRYRGCVAAGKGVLSHMSTKSYRRRAWVDAGVALQSSVLSRECTAKGLHDT